MATDPKSKWFSARIAEGFSLDLERAQDLIEKADCIKLFIEFFSATGPQKALFFYDGERLRYSTDDTTVYPGRILFFVRPVKRNVQIANAETEFTWASTTADALPSLQTLLSDVYIPLFERSPTWGKVTSRAVIDGYLTNIRKYVSTLKEAQIVLSERFDFKIPNDPMLNKIPVDPYLIQKTIADNPDLILTAERALAEVSNQVELFLAESTRVRVDDDSSGPESEIVYWRARMASFSAVHQRVHGISWLQSCVTLLQNTQSPVMQRWVRIKQRVLEGVTEAKDNLRYLYTIEEIMEPIYHAEPAKIAETVPHLMATVKIVHQMARYYSTTENMTTLLVKISNQMIRACREYLRTDADSLLIPRPGLVIQPRTVVTEAQGDDDDPAAEVIASLNKKRPSSDSLENVPTIYDRQPEDILKRIDECIQLCARYQQEYHNVRRQMQQEKCEKQFNFAESGIFGNFDLFCARLRKIADIIITDENFSSLQQSTLQNLHPILDQSEKLILGLRKKNYDPINHRLTQFDADHTEYMQGIAKLEDSISVYVNAVCDDENNTVNDIINLLRQLHVILNRPTMKALIMSKYEFLLNKYIDEISKVKTYFDENKDNPKIPLGWSPTAGRLAWVRLIMRRLTTVYEFFRRVQIHVEDENDPGIQRSVSFENLLQATTHIDEYLPLLSFYKAGRRAYKMYMKLVKQLFDYETSYHELWVESITSLRASLQATLLVEHPQTKKLYVNFDRKIVLLCREVHYLRQLRVEIPETALAITMHEKSLLHYRDSLQDLLEAIEEIKQSINPAVAELVKPLISKLNKKVQPGLKTLCWTSMSIGGYLDNIQKQVTAVKEVLKTVDDIISLRIATNLKAISTTCLLPLFKRYAFGDPHNDPSQGGTITLNNAPCSTPDDDNDEIAVYTNHNMRLFSTYLQHNTNALPYKQYLELVRPHVKQAAESIYNRSQLIAIAVIDVIIAITSRYISSNDSENAAMLSEIVTSAIQSCFMPANEMSESFAAYSSRKMPHSDSIVGTTMAESGEQPVTLEASKDDMQHTDKPASGMDAATVIKAAIRNFVDKFHDNTITAVFLCTERTLRAVYQRVTMYIDPHTTPHLDKLRSYYVPDAMILCDFELALPSTRLSPSWDDLRKGYIDAIALVLQVSKRLPKWNAGGDYMANVLTTIRPIISRQDPEFVAAQLAQTLATNATMLNETRSFTNAESAKSAKAAFERSSRATSRASAGSRGGDKKGGSTSARMGSLSLPDGKLIYDRAEFLSPIESFYGMIGKSRTLLKLLVALQGAFGTIIKKINAYLSVFDMFQSLWLDDKNETYKKFIDKRPELSDFLLEIIKFEKTIHNINLIPTMVQQGICVFSTEALKNSLQSEAAVWKGLFASNLNSRARLELSTMKNYISELQTTISKKINDLDDVRQIMIALGKLRELEAVFELKIQPIEEMYERLETHGIKITAEEAEDLSDLRNILRKLQDSSIKKQDELKEREPTLKGDLEEAVSLFKTQVKVFKENWDSDGPNVPGITPQRAVQQLKLFQTQFADIEQKWVTYQSGEETFGLDVTNYPELTQIKKDLKMLSSLYNLYTDVLSTIDGYGDQLWTDLNFDDIQVLMSDYQQRCLRLPKGMREWQAYIELQAKIEDFGTLLPLFQLMSHPAVKQRHWLEISKVTERPALLRVIEDPDNFRLKDLLEAPLLQYAEDLEDICSAATKETEIEEKLGVIRSQWQEQTFTFQEFKTRGLLNLAPSETSELIVMLEDSQMLLSSLVSNRFNKPFKEELSQWVKRLSTLDEILILWLQVQQNWIYLEAVFSGGDISRQLPAEAKRFSQIDKSWIKIMTTAVTTPNCIHLTSVDDTLKSLLPYLIEQLELCQKSLSGYLEQKRNLFARFYFVSDPVLLEILGQQSDPSSIQPHLLSIFDSIYMLDFDRVKRSNVIAINDRSGEKVQLSTVVEAKGSVEDWLNELIKVMQRSLKDIIRNAAADLTKPDVSVQEIFETYPAQVTLLAIQLLWTMWIEGGLRLARQDKKIMQLTLKKVNNLLQTLVSITLQDLNKRQRTNVETLVTIHVHQRDVSEELTNNKIKSPTDFEWLRQTRFYWSTDTDNCKIQITDIDFTYQNEYLGVNERLVITPLTDRCYITLAQAIGMYLGGAPAGPAGTGKTETVKDLGKTLGMYVVVFNCSDQMDYKGLGKIYRGIAQTGSFGDFDEFNRIDLPVLSVSAQQIQCVLSAVKERKKTFLYTDGCVITLIPSCGIFITMNPGYAGRQELPENLKALFRKSLKIKTTSPQSSIYLARKLFLSTVTYEEVVSLLAENERFFSKPVASLSAVEPGSIAVTDLPWESVKGPARKYILLHRDLLQLLLGLKDSKLFALPTRPDYYLSTVLCNACILVSGYKFTAPEAAKKVRAVIRQLGAEPYTTNSVDNILQAINNNRATYIVVPSSCQSVQLLSTLITHQKYVSNIKIKVKLSDDDVRHLTRIVVTEDLVAQLMHNRLTPAVQQRLLSREAFIPVLYGLTVQAIGDLNITLKRILLLVGATLVFSEDPQMVSFYSSSAPQTGVCILSVASQTEDKAYFPCLSQTHRIPLLFGLYKCNLLSYLSKYLLLHSIPDVSTIDPRRSTVSVSAVGQDSFMLSTLSGADNPFESYLAEDRRMLQKHRFTQVVTYSEAIVDGLLSQSLGCQYMAAQSAADSIFKQQNDIWRANYMSLKHCQGTYSDLLCLLRARPIICSFCTLDGVSLSKDAPLLSLDKAIIAHFQMLICSDESSMAVETSLYSTLYNMLQLPAIGVRALDAEDDDSREPKPKQAQAQHTSEASRVICNILSNEMILRDTMSILLHQAIAFIPFSVLPNIYSFIKDRLFIIVDPSLLIHIKRRITNMNLRDQGEGANASAVAEEMRKTLVELRQLRRSLTLTQFVPARRVTPNLSEKLTKDLDACLSQGGPVKRNYAYLDEVTFTELIEPEVVMLGTHYRSLFWLHLVMMQLLMSFLDSLVCDKQVQEAWTPFCLFASLEEVCPACGSKPSFSEAATLLRYLCANMIDILEFSGMDLDKRVWLEAQTPPGFLHWCLFARIKATEIPNVGSTLIEKGCARSCGDKPLCKVCKKLNAIFNPSISFEHLDVYRRTVYTCLSRTLITSLLLVWYDNSTVSLLACKTKAKPEAFSSISFMCQLPVNINTHTAEVYLPTFLLTLFREKGNYGIAETKGRRAYTLMCQEAEIAVMSRGHLNIIDPEGVELPYYAESTITGSYESASMLHAEKQHLYAFTVPEPSYEDPRFQKCADPPND